MLTAFATSAIYRRTTSVPTAPRWNQDAEVECGPARHRRPWASLPSGANVVEIEPAAPVRESSAPDVYGCPPSHYRDRMRGTSGEKGVAMSDLRSRLGHIARIVDDVQAEKKGRVGRRIGRRLTGRGLGRLFK